MAGGCSQLKGSSSKVTVTEGCYGLWELPDNKGTQPVSVKRIYLMPNASLEFPCLHLPPFPPPLAFVLPSLLTFHPHPLR